MAKVIMKSWREGLRKISLTHLQMELLNKSLKESKENVDLLLDGQEVNLLIDDLDIAKEFQRRANELGVECIVET